MVLQQNTPCLTIYVASNNDIIVPGGLYCHNTIFGGTVNVSPVGKYVPCDTIWTQSSVLFIIYNNVNKKFYNLFLFRLFNSKNKYTF